MQEHAAVVRNLEHTLLGDAQDGPLEPALQVLDPGDDIRTDRLVPEIHTGRCDPLKIGRGNENTGTRAGVVADIH
jgi:hypothetical protein